jgi:hypothetical protein
MLLQSLLMLEGMRRMEMGKTYAIVQKMIQAWAASRRCVAPPEQWLRQRCNAGASRHIQPITSPPQMHLDTVAPTLHAAGAARRQQRCAADRMVRGGATVCSHGEVDSCPDGARGDLQRPLDIIDGRGTSG